MALDFYILLVTDTFACPLNYHKVDEKRKKKKKKFVITVTSRFVAIDANQCDKCLPFDELYSKIIQFFKLSEAWVIFHGSKPEKNKKTKTKTK